MKKYKYILGTVLITVSVAACATITDRNHSVEESSEYAAGISSEDMESSSETEEPTTESTVETTVETTEESTEEETLSPEELEQLIYEERKGVLAQYNNLGVVANVTNNLNIRECAKSDGLIIGKAVEFAGLEIIGEEGDWYKIKVDDAYGYVAKEFVVTGEEAKKLAIAHAEQMAEVDAEVLNVRKGPSLLTNVMFKVSVNDRYSVVEQYENWVKVQVVEDATGYVSSDFVSVDYFLPKPYIIKEYHGLSETRRNIISMAFEYLGGKYVWGGTTLGVGVDCSGFMLRLFEAEGIKLHRVSIDQATNGRRVSAAEMKPGDLVFYETLGPYISHVALYIGDGKIIHAASERKGICINEWDYVEPVMIRNVIGD